MKRLTLITVVAALAATVLSSTALAGFRGGSPTNISTNSMRVNPFKHSPRLNPFKHGGVVSPFKHGGLVRGAASAAGYNYRLADGSIADLNLRCAGGSYVYFDRYASTAGIYMRVQLLRAPQLRDAYGRLVWGSFQVSPVSGWTVMAAGSTWTSSVPGLGTSLWALNVQFGKYVNGVFVTTQWYGADAFQSEGSSVSYTGTRCMTIF